jgi:hypothetical protein
MAVCRQPCNISHPASNQPTRALNQTLLGAFALENTGLITTSRAPPPSCHVRRHNQGYGQAGILGTHRTAREGDGAMTNDNAHTATNPLRSAVAIESWFLAKTEAGYDFALAAADTTCSMNASRWGWNYRSISQLRSSYVVWESEQSLVGAEYLGVLKR